MSDETENPLARQLRDQEDARNLASGRAGLEKDFFAAGKAQGAARLQGVWDLVQEYIRAYDAERTANMPGLRCPGKPPRFECIGANRFAAVFEGIIGLREYTLRVTVGYHTTTIQTMHNPPKIQRSEWVYQAYADDEAFWWRDPEGNRLPSEFITQRAMEALSTLIVGAA